ncbi:hypothetical protein G3576_00685 [Roseomonas stagni]|uniref:Uncharacterized protein n=1 Tax=Falsiroseomonas algicola TaxID=2716930 RepID=A0A6M1LDZ8_9PROT|nr:hypothetical protein [Falsiroseomonas algicola]NGM18508.1 hypothetical protein [Falsiroseomonas algicola]
MAPIAGVMDDPDIGTFEDECHRRWARSVRRSSNIDGPVGRLVLRKQEDRFTVRSATIDRRAAWSLV